MAARPAATAADDDPSSPFSAAPIASSSSPSSSSTAPSHMNEAARLVRDLEHKLADLDQRVTAYREGLAGEFARYQTELLRDVPDAVSTRVRRVIANSLPGRYPALSLSPSLVVDLASASASASASGASTPLESLTPQPPSSELGLVGRVAAAAASQRRASPPPPGAPAAIARLPSRADSGSLEGNSGSGARAPDAGESSISGGASAHAREKEFQGIFIPRFLPLLDGSQGEAASPQSPTMPVPSTPPPRARAAAEGPATSPRSATVAASGERGARVESQEARDDGEGATMTTRPSPPRRATDETTSSAASDRSDGSKQRRRSAMRRSSSASTTKPKSPHRVRFETPGGGEVLPSTSPKEHELASAQQAMAHSMPPPAVTGGSGSGGGSSSSRYDESSSVEALLGPDLEEPPPRRVSSTQRLRELSRLPLDNTTVWTEVIQPGLYDNTPSTLEKPASQLSTVDSSATIRGSPANTSATQTVAAAMPATRPADVETIRTETLLGRPLEERGVEPDDKDDDYSEDDFLSMGKTKSPANKKPVGLSVALASPKMAEAESDARKPDVSGKGKQVASEDLDDDDDDDDDMFDFEGGLSMPSRTRARPPPPVDDEDEDDDEAGEGAITPQPLNLYASSPAVAITRAPPRDVAGPPTPTTTKFQSGSLGSYRGRPVMMPVVTNPSVQAAAEELGEFHTFVGGLDGRSGMDAADMSSFRASLAGASGGAAVALGGQPRSFTERMIMEEQAEARARERGETIPEEEELVGDKM